VHTDARKELISKRGRMKDVLLWDNPLWWTGQHRKCLCVFTQVHLHSFLTLTLYTALGQLHVLVTVHLWMNLWHPLNRKLGDPRANISISKKEINIFPFQELILDSLAHSLRHYTDWASKVGRLRRKAIKASLTMIMLCSSTDLLLFYLTLAFISHQIN